MKEGYKALGEFIRQIDIRNTEGKEDNLLGVSVQKQFIPSIANTVGTDFTKYKVVKKGQFTYIPDTSRRGDKIAIALLQDYEEGLVSNVYTVFEVIDEEKLLPEYLMLWFSRPEFDRYARFKSHGSVREVMDWDEMCKVELPVPSIEKQRSIVREFSNNELPIEKKQFRERYIAVLKKFNMRLYSNRTLYVKRFSVKTRYGEQMELEERDIRNAFSTLEGRNQAYTRKYDRIADTAYLDRAVEKLEEFAQRIYPDYQIRKDLNVHELCFAIDSACTELARNDILLLWGVFTGKPITLAACGSKRGVSPSCIRQRQEMVVRNTGHGSRRIIMEPKAIDD